MRPIEPDYRKLCGDNARDLGLDYDKCVPFLRRRARRCHAAARRYLLAEGLNASLDSLSKNNRIYGKSTDTVAGTLSLIDFGSYSYIIDPVHRMLWSAIKGFGPTWQCYMLTLSDSVEKAYLPLGGERVEAWYHDAITIHFSDIAERGWNVIFKPDHLIMKYRQYRRWADVYRKWQDRALAATAARTL